MGAMGLLVLTTMLVAVQFREVFGQLSSNAGSVEGTAAMDGACICVNYFLCDNGKIITTAGRKLFEVRLDTTCDKVTDVCCYPPDRRPSRPAAMPAPTPTASNDASNTNNRTCGRRNPDGVDFTLTQAMNGETNFGEFPWMVAVLRREEFNDGNDEILKAYVCGGSLIHPQVVLTAAHCVHPVKIDELMIRAGEWDTQLSDEPLIHQERMISQVIIHEEYDDDTMFNDIALLILQEPVIIDQHIDVVCLPAKGENFDHTRCFSGGWGKDVFGREGQHAVILKKRELPMVPHSTCMNALRTARLGPFYELDDSFVCAGGESGVDLCQGDGGSPLVCPIVENPLHYKQVGIVSWGLGCGEAGVPGVYANVAIRRDWIDQKMAANNFDTNSYTYSKQKLL